MGWFSSSEPAAPTPAPSQDGGFIAPDRSARAQCWEGRDSFFNCLERNGIIDSVREDKKAREACPKELKEFEGACAQSWVGSDAVMTDTGERIGEVDGWLTGLRQVTYFKKRRVMEHQRDLTLKKLNAEGAQGMEVSSAGGAGAAALRGK